MICPNGRCVFVGWKMLVHTWPEPQSGLQPRNLNWQCPLAKHLVSGTLKSMILSLWLSVFKIISSSRKSSWFILIQNTWFEGLQNNFFCKLVFLQFTNCQTKPLCKYVINDDWINMTQWIWKNRINHPTPSVLVLNVILRDVFIRLLCFPFLWKGYPPKNHHFFVSAHDSVQKKPS